MLERGGGGMKSDTVMKFILGPQYDDTWNRVHRRDHKFANGHKI